MSQSFDYVEMKIPAKAEYVGVVRLTLSGIASRMGFAYEDIEDLKVATSEACTNAVQHAYEQNEFGEIAVGFGLYNNRLEVMVADSGKSFDFLGAKNRIGRYDEVDSVESLREGGLGLFLIETLMDEVRVHHKEGVTVFMIKYLERERVEGNVKPIST